MRAEKTMSSLNNKKTLDVTTVPDFKLYCRATVIKTVSHWHKDRPMEQGKRKKRERCKSLQL